MVTGRERPPTLNTELFELAAVTVTFAPLAVRLPDAVPLVPRAWLPRASRVRVTVSCPAAAVPVADRGMVSVGLDAVELMVTLPLALAADVPVNVTVKEALCPAGL